MFKSGQAEVAGKWSLLHGVLRGNEAVLFRWSLPPPAVYLKKVKLCTCELFPAFLIHKVGSYTVLCGLVSASSSSSTQLRLQQAMATTARRVKIEPSAAFNMLWFCQQTQPALLGLQWKHQTWSMKAWTGLTVGQVLPSGWLYKA